MLKRLDDQANYLDLTFIIGNNNRLYTKLYDKHDDINFHIIKFLFLSNIPSGPSYGLHMVFTFCSLSSMQDGAHIMMTLDIAINSQWTDFFLRAIKINRLRNSFQTFYGRYSDVVAKYQKSVGDMMNDSFLFFIQ